MIRFCNLCGFPLVRINKGIFGTRCVNCRSSFIHRALGKVLAETSVPADARVHEFSHHGAIFKYLKKRFKNLSTSEYYDDVKPGEFKNGIQCQDLQKLTFPDDIFDLMTSTEVFEHVPDDTSGYREVLRCLKKNGRFIFTVPITETYTTVTRAKMENGKLVHLLEPEYHGDHLRNQGSLAFRNYGLDLKDKLVKIGFSGVKMPLIEDVRHAITPAKRVVICTR